MFTIFLFKIKIIAIDSFVIDLKSYYEPFNDINNLYYGLYVISRFGHWPDSHTLNCIKLVTGHELGINSIQLLKYKLEYCDELYPKKFFENLKLYDRELTKYSIENNLVYTIFEPKVA